MDLDKLLKFLNTYLGDWLRVSVQTLVNPGSYFTPVPVDDKTSSNIAIPGLAPPKPLWLDNRLITYVIFSIVGAVRARKGIFYYFVFFGKVAYHQVYRIRPERAKDGPRNRPPGM